MTIEHEFLTAYGRYVAATREFVEALSGPGDMVSKRNAMVEAKSVRDAIWRKIEAQGGPRTEDDRITDLEAVFDLQRMRMNAATARWREAHPGNELVSPDLGDLLDWLMHEIDRRDGWFEKNAAGQLGQSA